MRLAKRTVVCLGGVGAAAMISPAFGSGFALNEQSASGIGNAFAGGAAIAEDATTVYFNPAGMTRIEGKELAVGTHIIMIKADFSEDGSTSALGGPLTGEEDGSVVNAFVPNVYYVTEFAGAPDWKFGLGVNVPFGLSTEYEGDWMGRYHGVYSDVKTINFNPSAAYEVSSKLSVGGGISIQYFEVELTSAIDFGGICFAQELGSVIPSGTCDAVGVNPQQRDGFATITGTGWSYGWNMGLLYSPSETTRFGFAYRSQIEHDLEGNADFTVPGEAQFLTASGNFVDTDAAADLTLPASASLSAYHQYNDKIAVMADLTWTNWKVFDELRIKYPDSPQPDSVTTEDWEDTFKLAVGLNYALDPKVTIRTGLAYEQSPIPDAEHRTPRIPGNDRRWITVGVGYKPVEDVAFDVGFAHLFTSGTDIDNTYESSVPTIEHTLAGSYDSTVNIFSFQFRKSF